QSRHCARYHPPRRTWRHAGARCRLSARRQFHRSVARSQRACQWRHRQSPQYRGEAGHAAHPCRGGPVDDLVAELNLLADGQPALAGKATIEQAADGLSIVADLGGPLSRLVAEPYRPFFGAETRLTANATMRSAGGFDLNAVSLSGGQLSLTARSEERRVGKGRRTGRRAGG